MTKKTEPSQSYLLWASEKELGDLIGSFFLKFAFVLLVASGFVYSLCVSYIHHAEIQQLNEAICTLAKNQIEMTRGIDMSQVSCLKAP